ncbi:MAG: hypothetical protein AABN34_10110 [Acidobacteriota bacterium]
MKSTCAAIVLGLVLGLAAIHMVRTDAATSSQEKPSNKLSDKYLGPIVDYELEYQAASVGDPKERALRMARAQRYNDRGPSPLGDFPPDSVGFATGTDWYIGVPALPLAQCDAVIVGEVAAAEAHISPDRTGVYSEFSIRVDEILKNSVETPVKAGDLTVGEREGGVVRFQGGRLFEYMIFHQGMPGTGRKYLFFLSDNKQGGDYLIVTAYELRDGQVIPLDDSHAFASYKGSDEQEFLIKVRGAIARGWRVSTTLRHRPPNSLL